MVYLVDTNTCVEYLRQRNSAVVARFAATPPGDIRLCSVVKAELYHGAHRSQQVLQNLVKVENFLRRSAASRSRTMRPASMAGFAPTWNAGDP